VTADDLGWALLFLAAVALMIAVGFAVGMIVAGRLDRIMAPRPPRPADAVPPSTPAVDADIEPGAGATAAIPTDQPVSAGDTQEEQP
jgi:hypothetical protein